MERCNSYLCRFNGAKLLAVSSMLLFPLRWPWALPRKRAKPPIMCLGDMATPKDEERVANLFRAIGKIWTADEKYFDAVTGLSGSGPAYVYIAIEALADGGVAAGLPRDLALALASQTVLGAAAMVNNSGKHPGQLKDAVTSPAGTTITGIHELEKGGFRGTLISAVTAAARRCQELA